MAAAETLRSLLDAAYGSMDRDASEAERGPKR